jgi:hypothetical protein
LRYHNAPSLGVADGRACWRIVLGTAPINTEDHAVPQNVCGAGPKLIKMGSVNMLVADDNLQTLEDVWAVIEASTSSRGPGSVAHMV